LLRATPKPGLFLPTYLPTYPTLPVWGWAGILIFFSKLPTGSPDFDLYKGFFMGKKEPSTQFTRFPRKKIKSKSCDLDDDKLQEVPSQEYKKDFGFVSTFISSAATKSSS